MKADKEEKIIIQHTPICPNCSALLRKRKWEGQAYYVCGDCKKAYVMTGIGQTDNEIKVKEHKKGKDNG